jgi:hypothetical protein
MECYLGAPITDEDMDIQDTDFSLERIRDYYMSAVNALSHHLGRVMLF